MIGRNKKKYLEQGQEAEFSTGSGGLRSNNKVSWSKSILAIVAVAFFGGLLVWSTFAMSAAESQVRLAYQEILHREGDDSGVAYWVRQIEENGKTIDDVRRALGASNECSNSSTCTPTSLGSGSGGGGSGSGSSGSCTSHYLDGNGTTQTSAALVEKLYQKYLGRTSAGDSGAQYWITALDSCRLTPQQVEEAIAGSAERKRNDADYQARRAEAVKAIEAAYMRLFAKAYSEKNGQFSPAANETYDYSLCTGHYQEAQRNNTLPPSFCFQGLGLDIPTVDGWVSAVLSGAISLSEAVEAISRGDVYSAGHCQNVVQNLEPSCGGGSVYVPRDTFAKLCRTTDPTYQVANHACVIYGQGPASTPGSGRRTVPSRGTTFNTNTSQSNTTSESSSTETGATKSSDKAEETPDESSVVLENISTIVVPMSKPETTVTACSEPDRFTHCVQLPVGDATSNSTPEDTSTTVEATYTSNDACEYTTATPTGCSENEYAQEWQTASTVGSSTQNQSNRETDVDGAKCSVSPYKVIKVGDKGDCVKVLQAYLGLAGYLTSIVEDPEYSGTLQSDVLKFQKDQDVTPEKDSSVRKETWDALREYVGKIQQKKKEILSNQMIANEAGTLQRQLLNSLIIPACDDRSTLSPGSTGDCVKRIQQILALISSPNLNITGTYDEATKQAVVKYQKEHNLSTSGFVDRLTRSLLEQSLVDYSVQRTPYAPARGTFSNNR